jgi:hypothetical protein
MSSMGQLRFVAPCREHLAERTAEFAYIAGLEGIPWPCRCRQTGNNRADAELIVERSVAESGNLYLPWRTKDAGELMLSTASLMERQLPYRLVVELARGTLNRVRNQLADWQLVGLQAPAELEERICSACRQLANIVIEKDPHAASRASEELINESLAAGERLAREYSRQMLAIRRQDSSASRVLVGGRLPRRPLLDSEDAFVRKYWNAVSLSFPWRTIESSPGKFDWELCDRQVKWCTEQGLRIVSGPLVSLTRNHLPDWLFLWEEDFENLQQKILHFVRAVVNRYRGLVHVWNSLAGMNVPGALAITEEQRLRLAVVSIDELRKHDSATPVLVTVDQPWGEYLTSESLELSPLHFADALQRADLGLAGIGLEWNVGYWPGGTLPRDSLEVSRQLDRWSLLGLPLVVFVTLPSSGTVDESARLSPQAICEGTVPPSGQSQRDGAERLLPLALAKPFVQGVFWNQLSDQETPDCAHGGLFDGSGQAKPVCEFWQSWYTSHLT